MRFVIVESPYAGDVGRNVDYARRCMADCLRRGEAPYASHLLYTQPGVLDDNILEERIMGIEAGLQIAKRADCQVFYIDLGWSNGMIAAADRAAKENRPTEVRSLHSAPHDECRECACGL